ncbi:RNA exonuclease 4 [Colossoma macropomum]|uniref:RNA exonuclease 4 n=1 Tax=Colossoma macropomum TaxID=42526 RepID=UPI001864E1A0|nr:RNA exonuclease 4 [Colossoma macropomum]
MSKWKGKHAGRKHRAKAKGEKEERSVEKKKTQFFRRVKKKQKRKEKKTAHLPPKEAQAFSANWKNLAGLLNWKPTAGTEKSALQKEEPKPQSAVNKDSHSAAQKTDKNVNKSGHKPQKTINKASHDVKTKSPEDAGAQQNGKGPSGPKQHKAEKRKAKDSGGGDKRWINKKKKAEEAEKQPTESDIWFDDVDPDDIEAALGSEAADLVRKRSGVAKSDVESTERQLVKERAFDGLTHAVAMDCEMVGVGPDGEDSMLARVSIVNYFGKCIYDKYVKPTEKVTDYRTAVSGIRPADIESGEDISTVQKEVAEILKGRILVGHAIHNDLKILLLDHPKKMIRDTQKYKEFKKITKSSRPALRVLSKKVLNVNVQQGEHSSVQDAQATMRLYTMVKKRWEAELKAGRKAQKSPRKPKADS